MGFEWRVEKHSVDLEGREIVSFVVTYPRAILPEVNTHTIISKNTSSSRAIPYSRKPGVVRRPEQPRTIREMVLEDPYLPIYWGRNEAGMQASTELSEREVWLCKSEILDLRDAAVLAADRLWGVGMHKQDVNRYLEPWAWTTQILTGTQWANFFALRTHQDAHPAFRYLARKMYVAYRKSVPQVLRPGEWHLPFVDASDAGWSESQQLEMSVARCARLSYCTHDTLTRSYEKDLELFKRLSTAKPGHMCYDSETEVLTDEGWKRWNAIRGTERFCSLDLTTDQISYDKPTHWHLHQAYEGKMIQVDGTGLDLCVTPNHNMVVSYRTTKESRKKDAPTRAELVPAYTLMGDNTHRYYKGGHKKLEKFGHYDDRLLELLGFALGDGYRSYNKLHFHLYKQRKVDYLRSLADVTESEGGVFKMPYPFDFDIYQDKKKYLPQELLTSENCEALFTGLMNSDGSDIGTHTGFYNSNEELIDQFCQIATNVGWGHNKALIRPGYWRVSLLQRNDKPVPRSVKVVEYKGAIHCVTVPKATLMVRRNGKAVWSGNSPFLHQGRAMRTTENWIPSNLTGWQQFRKMVPNECIWKFEPTEQQLLEWEMHTL